MGTRSPSLASFAFVVALGCAAKPPQPEPESLMSRHTQVNPELSMPPQLVSVVDEWRAVANRNFMASFGRGRHCQVKWADAVGDELAATREQARETIQRANPNEQAWLVFAYVDLFALYGFEGGWLDPILLDVPPDHPAWSSAGSWLFKAIAASDQPARLEQHVLAAADTQAIPRLHEGLIYRRLETADRAGDSVRARELFVSLQQRELEQSGYVQHAFPRLDPDRPFRTGSATPHVCGAAITGPHAGRTVCLDELVPHALPTLVLSLVEHCDDVLPRVTQLAADRPLRVIVLAHEGEFMASTGLPELPDWTVLVPEPQEGQATTFMALIDPSGTVLAGPPWLDLDGVERESSLATKQ